MKTTIIKMLVKGMALGVLATAGTTALAQDYPRGLVRIIVPFPAGGPTDVVGRVVAQKLQESWGSSVIVENKPGAGTVLGSEAVAKSAPDGQTLGVVIGAHVINPGLRASLPYDTLKDFAHITQISAQQVVLVAHSSAPFSTVPELIAHAKANPGKLTYASPGAGTGTHLAGELFQSLAGIRWVHVPYKGSGPAVAGLVAGRVDTMFDILHSAMPQVQAGKTKLLALTAGTRPEAFKQYPVVAETLPGFHVASFFGLVGPAAMPRAVVNKVQADVARALALPEVRERLAGLGLEPVGSRPEQFDAFVRAEVTKWTKVIKDNGIKAE